jgi:hypothetical protein
MSLDAAALAGTLAGMHFLAFVFVMLNKAADTFGLVHNTL